MTNRHRQALLSFMLILVATARVHADDIDDYVRALIEQRHIPAASIAVIKDGVLVKAEGYGLADMENNFSARPDTVLSTALDMAKWEVALQSDRILKASTKTQMWTPVALNDGKTYPYGFGWELDDFPPGGFTTGVTSVRHEGTIPGFRAAYTRLPKHGIAVIVLTNLDGAALDSVVAGIAVRYAPEVIPAALQRWTKESLRIN